MSTIPYVAGTRTNRARSVAAVALLRTLPANEKVVFDEVNLLGLNQAQIDTRSRGLSARVSNFTRRNSNKNGLGVVFGSTKRDGDRVVATVYTNRSPVDAVTSSTPGVNVISVHVDNPGQVADSLSKRKGRKRDYVTSANSMLDRLAGSRGQKLTLSAVTLTGNETPSELRSKRNAQYYLVRTLQAEAEARGLKAEFATRKSPKAIRVDGRLV